MNNYSMQRLSPLTEIPSVKHPHWLGRTAFGSESLPAISSTMRASLKAHGFPLRTTPEAFDDYIRDFFEELVPGTPDELINKAGSTSFQGLLPLWIAAQELKPSQVVESGVFVGGSLRMFRAVLPDARIDAYDISFGPLAYHDSTINYVESEWSLSPPDIADGGSTLAFFDDHIDAVRRLKEARALNIRWVLFDDNPSIGDMAKYRYPSIPSVPMILNETLPDKATLQWHHVGTGVALQYTHDAAACAEIREQIVNAVDLFAALSSVGCNCGDKWLVELKTNDQ